MKTESLIESSRRVDKAGASTTRSSGKKVSQEEPCDTIEAKFINHMAKIRDEVAQGVTLRFPIKGLDTIVRQVFDRALEESIDALLNILGLEFEHSPLVNDTSKAAHTSAISQAQNSDSHDEIHPQTKINERKKVERPERASKIPESNHGTKIGLEKDEKTDEIVKNYLKRIEELMLAVKARDGRILDQKKDIEKLQNSLNLLEKQSNSPFVSYPAPNSEEEIQIRSQMQSLMEFMRKITPILEKDPKYKIMFLLKRVGKFDICKLSEDLCIPLKKLNTLVKELETMKIVRREEDTVFLRDIH